MGVVVYDNEQTWRVQGSRGYTYAGGSAERRIDRNDGKAYTRAEFIEWYGGTREWEMSNDVRGGATDDRRQRRRERDARRIATRSKPYARAAECTASLAEAELQAITDLINERLRKKLDRRFDEADALLSELEGRGVAVSDDLRSWRADGLSFVYPYACKGGRAGRSEQEVARVQELVHERGEAKSHGRYEDADKLAEALFDLGVDLDDDARTWQFVYAKRSAGGSAGGGGAYLTPKNHDYQRDPADDYQLSAGECERIDDLLRRRLAAKKAREFDRADALQAELRAAGVEVDDKVRIWYVRYDRGGGRAASSFNVRGR